MCGLTGWQNLNQILTSTSLNGPQELDQVCIVINTFKSKGNSHRKQNMYLFILGDQPKVPDPYERRNIYIDEGVMQVLLLQNVEVCKYL